LLFFWFGLCCLNYVIAGVTMLYTKPNYMPLWFPYGTFALFLIYIQSPVSYIADYICITKDSYWHVVDRCIAIPGMMLEMLKYMIMIRTSIQYPHRQSYVTCILYGLALVSAFFCFIQSQKSQGRIDRNGFVFWHTMWHLYPCVASMIIWFDHVYLKHSQRLQNENHVCVSESNVMKMHRHPAVVVENIYETKKTTIKIDKNLICMDMVDILRNESSTVKYSSGNNIVHNQASCSSRGGVADTSTKRNHLLECTPTKQSLYLFDWITSWIHQIPLLHISGCIFVILAIVTNTLFVSTATTAY
jgi:hypothetical protein